jgi:hypothetical protein
MANALRVGDHLLDRLNADAETVSAPVGNAEPMEVVS